MGVEKADLGREKGEIVDHKTSAMEVWLGRRVTGEQDRVDDVRIR